MDIKVFRTRFKGKNSYGIPFGDLIPVSPAKDENNAFETDGAVAFNAVTHDRGNPDHPTKEFYQIVFRITGDDQEKSELELVLDRDHGNPLFYDKEYDLWYQRTWFRSNERPSNQGPSVDSINTAGVFQIRLVNVQNRKELLSATIRVLPSLISLEEYQYMLDRLLSIHERLVVHTENAIGIGSYDSRKKRLASGTPEYDVELWNRLKPEIHQIIKMPATLQQKKYSKLPHYKVKHFDNRVIQSLIESGNQWAEGAIYTDNYDTQENRLIKNVIQKLAVSVFCQKKEKLLSQNQINNAILKELESQYSRAAVQWYRSAIRETPSLVSTYTAINSAEFHSGEYQAKTYQTQYQSGSSRKLRIHFKTVGSGYEIRTFPIFENNWNYQSYYDPFTNSKDIPGFAFYPFTADDVPCGLLLHTTDLTVAYSILLSLAKLYDEIENGKCSHHLCINCIDKIESIQKNDKLHFRYRDGERTVVIYKVKNVTSCHINCDNYENKTISSIYDFYVHMANTSILKYMETPREMELVEFVQAKKDYYFRLNTKIQAANDAADARQDIDNLLSGPWFKRISFVSNINFQRTPIFMYNKYYRSVYNTLNEIIQYHPLLTSEFEENLYGVHETALVYEYWVFYELLNRFLNLGFSVDDEKNKLKGSLFKLFTRHLLNNEKPEGFAIKMRRKIQHNSNSDNQQIIRHSIEVMIGFNCIFGDQKAPLKKKYDKYLTPDYFIRVTREDGYHWYFLDAKYEEYSDSMLYERATGDQRKNSIADVCYDKYTIKMADRSFIDEFAEYHSTVFPGMWQKDFLHKNFIDGAYLIVARYHKETADQITMQDRLFGNNAHGIMDNRPLHCLGSIAFRPKLEDELTSLIELIFEYKEGSQLIETGNPVKKTIKVNGIEKEKWDIFNNDSQITAIHTKRLIDKRPMTLFACWDSSNDHPTLNDTSTIDITPQLTKGGKYKFHITCSCGARRYENYCICKKCRREIIKHDSGNYHFRNSSASTWDKWNYVCPYCGSDIDPTETEDQENDSVNGETFPTSAYTYTAYQEPPPLTDEELASMAPPEQYDNDYDELPF